MVTSFLKSKECDYPHYGQRSYHIEIRHEGNIWHQRHVWTAAGGDVEIGEWIPTSAFHRDGAFQEVSETELSQGA